NTARAARKLYRSSQRRRARAPSSRASSGRSSRRRIAAASPRGSPGATTSPQSSRISGIIDTDVETIGRPSAIASKSFAGTRPTVSVVSRWRPGRVVARRVPGVGVARVGEQHATEALGQEARRGRASVGASHEALGRPCPREPVGVGEVERSAGAAPEPGAVQEPELPVVDVEEQRTPTARTREQAETVTRRTRLGRDDEVAVDQREERGQTSKEPRVLP